MSRKAQTNCCKRKEKKGNILSGSLTCDRCTVTYTISDGILITKSNVLNTKEEAFRDFHATTIHPMGKDLDLWPKKNKELKITTDRIDTLLSCTQKGDYVLDIGAGFSYYWLDYLDVCKPILFDFSLATLQLAKKRFEKKGFHLNYICGDALALPFSHNSFNAILSIQTYRYLEHFHKKVNQAFITINHMLKESGCFYYNQLNLPILKLVLSDLIKNKPALMYEDENFFLKTKIVSQLHYDLNNYFNNIKIHGRFPYRRKTMHIPGIPSLLKHSIRFAKFFAHDLDAFCFKKD